MNIILFICIYIKIFSDLIHSPSLSALIVISYDFTFAGFKMIKGHKDNFCEESLFL